MTWQPIATAPKDGTPFLAWDEYHLMQIAVIQNGKIYTDRTTAEAPAPTMLCRATHWMPLPPAPETTT